MTPSAQELADGQKAIERMERYKRCTKPFDLVLFVLIMACLGLWNAYQRGGWNTALGAGVFWSVLTIISIYQVKAMKKQTEADTAFLADLKAKYGANVYAEIQKQPHSLFYNIFLRRFPGSKRRNVTLP